MIITIPNDRTRGAPGHDPSESESAGCSTGAYLNQNHPSALAAAGSVDALMMPTDRKIPLLFFPSVEGSLRVRPEMKNKTKTHWYVLCPTNTTYATCAVLSAWKMCFFFFLLSCQYGVAYFNSVLLCGHNQHKQVRLVCCGH